MDTMSAIMCLLVFCKLSLVVCDEGNWFDVKMDILSVLTFLLIFVKQSLVLCDEVDNNNGTSHYIAYQGFGDLVLACNGSDVIAIKGVKLITHSTVCSQDTCTLSANDTLFIENCNDSSTCKVPVHDMSGCITQNGYYNVHYSCKMNALSCNFDENRCELQHVNGSSKWKVDEAQKAELDYRDHTTNNLTGRLMFVKTGQFSETKMNNLVLSSPKQCLSLYYWTNTDKGYLTFYRDSIDGRINNGIQLPIANHTWKRYNGILNHTGDYYLRFKATGKSPDNIFLIDDITIKNADCEESRDHIQYDICRKVDAVTLLDGCGKSYIKKMYSHFDPMKENCYSLLTEEAGYICDNSSFLFHCDTQEVLNRYPSCFNLNTLMINYTCKERKKNVSINIGLTAGAVSGAVIVYLIFAVLFVICRNTEHERKRTDNTLSSRGDGSGYLPSNRPTNAASDDALYGQNLARTSKQSQRKPGNYPKRAGVNENNQSMYVLASDVNPSQDDDYEESVAGIYDISGSNRHKVNDPIYSFDHSVDETYDTSYQGRLDNTGDETYSHMFGKQTEDDYDIARS